MVFCTEYVTVRSDVDRLKRRVHFFDLAHEIEPQRFDSVENDYNDAQKNLVWYTKKDFSRFEKLNRALVDRYKSSVSTCCSIASSTIQRKSGTDSFSTSEETTSDESYDEEEEFGEFNESLSLYGTDTIQAKMPICLRGLENISSLRAKVSLLHRFRDYHTIIINEQKRQQSLGIIDPIRLGEVAMAVSKTSTSIALQAAKDDAEFAKDYCNNVSHSSKTKELELSHSSSKAKELEWILNQKVFSDSLQIETKLSTNERNTPRHAVHGHDSVQSFGVRKKIKDHGKKNSFFGFAPVSKNAVQIEFHLDDDEDESNSVRSTKSTFSAKLGMIRNRMIKGNGRKSKIDTDSISRCSAATAPLMPTYTRSRKPNHIGAARSIYTPPVSSTSFLPIKQNKSSHTSSGTILEDSTDSTTPFDEDNDITVQIRDRTSGRRTDVPSTGTSTKANRCNWQPPSPLTQTLPTHLDQLTSLNSKHNNNMLSKSSVYVYTPETSMSSFNLSMTSLSSCRSTSMCTGSKESCGILKHSSTYDSTYHREQAYSFMQESHIDDEQALLHLVGDRIQI
jgi:hypothetical protein